MSHRPQFGGGMPENGNTQHVVWSDQRPTQPQSNNLGSTNLVAATKGPLPSVLFAIPFPDPGPTHRKSRNTPSLMLYSLPRANYIKPPKQANGRREKEALIKKIERKWQEEVQEGQDVKDGKIENPSSWKRFKGTVLCTASRVLKWLPDSSIETLGRLPPGKKLGLITILYPHEADEMTLGPVNRQPQEIRQGIEDLLRRARKTALIKIGVSGLLLPVTAAIDFFLIIPIFAFEINIVYFTLQINGVRKVTAITRANASAKNGGSQAFGKRASRKRVHLKERMINARRRDGGHQNGEGDIELSPQPTSPRLPDEPIPGDIFNFQQSRPQVFQHIMAHVYSLCSAADPIAFPSRPNGSTIPPFRPDRRLSAELIQSFREQVTADVALRHNLDPEFVTKDLRRCLKKGVKNYMRTLRRVN
ncbi:hypothetical protein O181_003590 [Austropuccinia psidii MF-1]|uniref:Uncharacterized protein n=1 Tax=Austropuccinia psidii MF-1 TaxID=1389203 RepID=A0A9Q3BFA8_9BASI|nr:hypothetical protein [Austropuccinia psidii MF-1]